METDVYVLFIGISTAVLVFPGPSVLLIVANGLQQGTVAGLYTVAGGLVAMFLQLIVALAGLLSLDMALDTGFVYVRWLGAVYLLYLGVQRWRGVTHEVVVRSRAVDTYRTVVIEGFVVALTNPGTMLFFVAFFPQFLNRAAPATNQLVLLAATFLVLTLLVDSGYAVLSARIGHSLHDPSKEGRRGRLSGALLVFAAVVLAFANF